MANNEAIKKRAWKLRIPQWKIARELGVSEMTITRWLRTELTDERFQKLTKAIDKIATED